MAFVAKRLEKDGILTLTLNRPDKLNALNQAVLHELKICFEEAKENPAVKGLLLTGEGKAFCAGADISELSECDTQSGYAFATLGQSVFRQLETLGKPSIAAVNGVALGGGCELIQAATLRLASVHAKFGQPEVKLGVIPGYGGTQRLARLVGKGRALDLCLTGRLISAEVALSWGLVSEVFEAHVLLEKAYEWLRNLLALAPLALAGVMDVIDRGVDLPLPDALHLEALEFAKVCSTQDKAEGVQAFLEKRPAVFRGI